MTDCTECSICMELFDTHPITSTLCGHTFHIRCIRRWFLQSQTCPLCRTPIWTDILSKVVASTVQMRKTQNVQLRLLAMTQIVHFACMGMPTSVMGCSILFFIVLTLFPKASCISCCVSLINHVFLLIQVEDWTFFNDFVFLTFEVLLSFKISFLTVRLTFINELLVAIISQQTSPNLLPVLRTIGFLM